MEANWGVVRNLRLHWGPVEGIGRRRRYSHGTRLLKLCLDTITVRAKGHHDQSCVDKEHGQEGSNP